MSSENDEMMCFLMHRFYVFRYGDFDHTNPNNVFNKYNISLNCLRRLMEYNFNKT